jgi:hypothetical protein
MKGSFRKFVQNLYRKIEVKRLFWIPDSVGRKILEWISEIGFKNTISIQLVQDMAQ